MPTVNRYQQDFDALLARDQLTADQLPGLVEAWNKKVEPVHNALLTAAWVANHHIDEYEAPIDNIRIAFPQIDTADGSIREDQLNHENLIDADHELGELYWRRDPEDYQPVLILNTIHEQPTRPGTIAALQTATGVAEAYRIPENMAMKLVRAMNQTGIGQWIRHLNAMRAGRLGIWSVLAENLEMPRYISFAPVAPDWLEPSEKIIGTIQDIQNTDSDKQAWMLLGEALNQISADLPADSDQLQTGSRWWPLRGLHSTLRTVQRVMSDHIEAQQALVEAQKLIESKTMLGQWLAGSELMGELTDLARPIDITSRLQGSADQVRINIREAKDLWNAQQRSFERYQQQWSAGWPESLGPVPPVPTKN